MCTPILSRDTSWCTKHDMYKLQMASQSSGPQHKRVLEAARNAQQSTSLQLTPKTPESSQDQSRAVLVQTAGIQVSKKHRPFPSASLAVACLLSITVNITEQEVQGWEEVKHKPAAQCTCLAAACSDILGHGDLVERTDAH